MADDEETHDEYLQRHAKAAAATYELLLAEGRMGEAPAVYTAMGVLDENKVRWTLFDRVARDLIAERLTEPVAAAEDIDIDEATLEVIRANDSELKRLWAAFVECAKRQEALLSEVPGMEAFAERMRAMREQSERQYGAG